MPTTPEQFREMEMRLAKNRRHNLAGFPPSQNTPVADGCEVSGIHKPILQWCKDRHPRVPVLHIRTDRRSGATEGAPDLVIPYRGKVLLVEAKTKTGKLSKEQIIWHRLAELQGVKTFVVRSYEDFLDLVK